MCVCDSVNFLSFHKNFIEFASSFCIFNSFSFPSFSSKCLPFPFLFMVSFFQRFLFSHFFIFLFQHFFISSPHSSFDAYSFIDYFIVSTLPISFCIFLVVILVVSFSFVCENLFSVLTPSTIFTEYQYCFSFFYYSVIIFLFFSSQACFFHNFFLVVLSTSFLWLTLSFH